MKRCAKKHRNIDLVKAANWRVLASGEIGIPVRYDDYVLVGNMKGYCEFRAEGRGSDWVLVCKVYGGEDDLVRTGSHDEVF